MELRTLHYFLTVAREQSISAAAESLHLSLIHISCLSSLLPRFIQSIDAVDGALELAGEAVVVDWRGKNDHLRLVQQLSLIHI